MRTAHLFVEDFLLTYVLQFFLPEVLFGSAIPGSGETVGVDSFGSNTDE